VSELLAVGRVARAHGLGGRILLVPYNEDSQELVRLTELWLRAAAGEPRRFEVARAERANLGYLVALRGVEDRDAADALRGLEALVDRAALPPTGDDEVYAADLIGMAVVDASGASRGTVTELETAGLQELLHVRSGDKVALVPLGLVREVDEEARRIVVDAPEGLFELEE
jgi:16S rRNA processing protein RimM